MPVSSPLSVRETAALAGVSKAAVEKAIEHGVTPALRRPAAGGRGTARTLPLVAVGYFAAVRAAGLVDLPVRHKRAIWIGLRDRGAGPLGAVTFAPGTTIDLDRLAGAAVRSAADYVAARDAHIVSDPDILGGTPVLRGTRLTVYAVAARLDAGEPMAALTDDYPGLPPEAFDAAALYARTHPLRGRPGGKPWRHAA